MWALLSNHIPYNTVGDITYEFFNLSETTIANLAQRYINSRVKVIMCALCLLTTITLWCQADEQFNTLIG